MLETNVLLCFKCSFEVVLRFIVTAENLMIIADTKLQNAIQRRKKCPSKDSSNHQQSDKLVSIFLVIFFSLSSAYIATTRRGRSSFEDEICCARLRYSQCCTLFFIEKSEKKSVSLIFREYATIQLNNRSVHFNCNDSNGSSFWTLTEWNPSLRNREEVILLTEGISCLRSQLLGWNWIRLEAAWDFFRRVTRWTREFILSKFGSLHEPEICRNFQKISSIIWSPSITKTTRHE